MRRDQSVARDIDDYISRHSPEIQARLAALRAMIHRHAPAAEERISYSMPTFYLAGNLVHFAAFERHIGFYPGAGAITAFQTEIAGYTSGKGSVQFPNTEPLPLDLVAAIVDFRVAQQAPKIAGKTSDGGPRRRRSRT